MLFWCGSTHAFPFGEGGTAIAVTEEALPQYEFAENHRKNATRYRTSPAPFGGTLPKGEGFSNGNFFYFFSSFQNSLLKRIRLVIMAIQPQVMKQSATLNTGNRMNLVSSMSTT